MTDTRFLARAAHERAVTPRLVLMRSLFPIVALALILGTTLWGPWVSLVLTVLWWNTVTRIA